MTALALAHGARALDVTTFLQSLANGVVFGAILALCAIGLTLVYGILDLSNFAHGDMVTFGAYMALFFGIGIYSGHQHLELFALAFALLLGVLVGLDRWRWRRLTKTEARVLLGFAGLLLVVVAFLYAFGRGGVGTTNRVLFLAALLSVAASVLLSLGFEFALWRPLRRRGATLMSLVIASLGLSFLLRNGIQQVFGGEYRALARPVDVAETYFGVYISGVQFVALGVTALVIAGVHLLLTRTRTGKAMRALADNRDLAKVCGIDVDRTIVYVWSLAAALVAIAGVLLALVGNNNVNVNMGFAILIPIFASVVLGGIGSAYGAMLGGLVVGIAMKLAPSRYDLAGAFLVLILVLLFRPRGILGRKA